MRLLIALAALALAACGQPAEKGAAAPAPAPASGAVSLNATQQLPDWLLVARTPDRGYVHFNQRTITRGADGAADIWVQVTYGGNQIYEIESATDTTTIRYTVERIHYRFRCADETYVVAERQIMGPGEEIVARDEPAQVWAPTPANGGARLVMPIACRGA
jgi:hypothetical protein